jgi:hypothetical protein
MNTPSNHLGNMKLFINLLFLTGLLCTGLTSISAQQILLDKPVRAGELILFPEISNGSNYYYLADKPRLALHPDGDPQFSFVRYVKNELSDGSGNNSIIESNTGGGVLHALVELSVSDDQIKEAQSALRRIDGDGRIVGPVIFKSGSVALISAIANEQGDMVERIVGLGNAPILETQKSAVAVQLNKLGSKILWETFNTPTPDFSINFEMEVEGFLSPKRVLIEADFERVYKHKAFEAAATTPVLSAEISAAFDDLSDVGAIKVTQIGTDEQLDRLKETAYNQLINLMFDKIGGTGVPQMNEILPGQGQPSMLERATTSLNRARDETRQENARIDNLRAQMRANEARVRDGAQSRAQARAQQHGRTIQAPQGAQRRPASDATAESSGSGLSAEDIPERQAMPSLAVAVSYRMKEIKRTGKYTIDLNKYTETTRSMPFAYNPGNVRAQCPDCFLEVNLDDDLMKQREINASLGGLNTSDFDYINFVNVVMKKKHQNGQESVNELKIDKSKFDQTGNFFRMMYGWKGDTNRDEWLKYEYRTMWSFKGGHSIETPWESTEFGSIALSPSVVEKPVYIEVDENFVFDEDVRGIEIKLFSKISDREEMQSINLKTQSEELSKTVKLLLPRDVEAYEYQVTYFIRGQDPRSTNRIQSNYGRIDIDRFL